MEVKQMASIDSMSGNAVAVVGLAAVTLTGLAVVQGYSDTGLVDNTTADAFLAGLAIFGTFMAVIVLSLVGKIIVGMFRKD
jgi:hypothetical protein